MLRVFILSAIALVTLASCNPEEKLEPYRCLDHVSLQRLIAAAGPPGARGWSAGSQQEEMPRQKIFDLEDETSSLPELPDGYVGRLCQRLKTELAQRCQVRRYWEGDESCAVAVSSPMDKITGPGGVYKLRGMDGRVNLFTARSPEGKKLVLTGSEWPG